MNVDRRRWVIGCAIAGGTALGALVLAYTLLVAPMTTLRGSTDPASALAARTLVVVALAVVPVLVTGVALVGAYYRRHWIVQLSAGTLLVLGVVGTSFGFAYLGMGAVLLVGSLLVATESEPSESAHARPR